MPSGWLCYSWSNVLESTTMQVLNPNDVKIYNLTHGKSIPDWLSDRKKRLLLKSDVGLQKRIQLMQEFEMPISSQKIAITPDKTHIYVSGVYPPRLRFGSHNICYFIY